MATPTKDDHLEDEERRSLALEILKALRGLHYGTVSITVHDGQVVQIDRHERHRLPGASKTRTA